MKYLPVFLNLLKRNCTVFGGGMIAERKIRLLLKTGADITVISPHLTAGLKRLASEKKIIHKARTFRPGDTRGSFLVIAATSQEQVNRNIAREVRGLVNAVDMPESCTFIVPSIISRGDLTIAVSTSGTSPAFARTLRHEIETDLPDELSKYLSYLRNVRKRIRSSLPGTSKEMLRKRSLLLKKFGSPDFLNELTYKGFAAVKKKIETILKENSIAIKQ